MKIFYRPSHIVDRASIYFKLDGKELSIMRIPHTMVLTEEMFSHMEDFTEVGSDEFLSLVDQHASPESILRFGEEYARYFI